MRLVHLCATIPFTMGEFCCYTCIEFNKCLYLLLLILDCFICLNRRPTALHDPNRDSDDDDYQNRDYDVAALANNLSQAFRYGIYSNDDIDEVLFRAF